MEIERFETAVSNCPVISYQTLDVCVPVCVKPFAKIGLTKTNCFGEASIISGDRFCDGIPNGECNFIVNQKICVEVPVVFGATTRAGDVHVKCSVSSLNKVGDSK